MIRAKRIMIACLAVMLLLTTGVYAADEDTTEITAVEPTSENESATEALPQAGDEYSSITILEGVANDGETPQFTDNLNQSTITATGLNESQYFPFKIANVEENGQMLVAKSYEVPADVNANDLIEGNVTRGEQKYKARDILQKKIKGEDATKTVRKPVTISSESKDKAKIMALLQPTIEYDESGYHGTLTLETESLTTEAAGSSTYNYELTDTKEYTGLERNDPSLVSKTVTKNGVTLNMSNIEWLPMGSTVSGDSVVQSYKAVVTYGGTAVGSKTSSYTATAQYSGEVIKNGIGSCVYTIVYEPVKEILVKKSIELPEISGQSFIVACGVLAGLLMAGLLILASLIMWRKNRSDRVLSTRAAYIPRERSPYPTEQSTQKIPKKNTAKPPKEKSSNCNWSIRAGKRAKSSEIPQTSENWDDYFRGSEPATDELSERMVCDAKRSANPVSEVDYEIPFFEDSYSGLYTEDDSDADSVSGDNYSDGTGNSVTDTIRDRDATEDERIKKSLEWVSADGFTIHDGESNAQAALELLERMTSDSEDEGGNPSDAESESEPVEDDGLKFEDNQETVEESTIASKNSETNSPDEDEPEFAEPANDSQFSTVQDTDEELVLPSPVDFDDSFTAEEENSIPSGEDEPIDDMDVYLPADADLPTISIDDDPALIRALQLDEENEDEQ